MHWNVSFVKFYQKWFYKCFYKVLYHYCKLMFSFNAALTFLNGKLILTISCWRKQAVIRTNIFNSLCWSKNWTVNKGDCWTVNKGEGGEVGEGSWQFLLLPWQFFPPDLVQSVIKHSILWKFHWCHDRKMYSHIRTASEL